MPCSFTALLWIPNLGTTICRLSQMYGITLKTCNKIHPKFALPFWHNLQRETCTFRSPSIVLLAWISRYGNLLQTKARHYDHWQQITTALTQQQQQQQQQKRNKVVWSKSSVFYSATMQDLHLPKIFSQQNKENLERTAKEFDKQ